MEIILTFLLLIYMAFVNWHSLKEMKRGNELKAIYDLLMFIATTLFIIATRMLSR